ncbi:MAG: FHA domain-containing protein, partial [Polyangia bacterium]
MPAKLLYRDASGKDASVDIAPEGCFLGRAADCAVRTDDAMVSRKNCKISFAGGRWSVEDLGSSNGTFVNEQRIQKQVLSHADVVRCGTLQVRFVEVAGSQPAVSQKPKTMSIDLGAAGVQVDPSLTGPLDPTNLMALKEQELQRASQERDALAARLREASQELESVHVRQEADQAELKRLRADLVQQRDRLSDVTRQKSLQDEELNAQTKVAEELRLEVASLKDEQLQVRSRNEELTEEMAARDRQLERALEDVQRAKVATD